MTQPPAPSVRAAIDHCKTQLESSPRYAESGLCMDDSDRAVEVLIQAAAERDALREENAALRGTLSGIRDIPSEDNEWDGTQKFEECQMRARVALEGK